MNPKYIATRTAVKHHKAPPEPFLDKVVAFCATQPDELFAPNRQEDDIYAKLRPVLAPRGWPSPDHRRAAMAEGMRVHAAFESDYRWDCGVDITNARSQTHPAAEETGIFQFSFDSEYLSSGLRAFLTDKGIVNPATFITIMKTDQDLVLRYYAQLVRITTRWAGSWNRGEVQATIDPASYIEFLKLILDYRELLSSVAPTS